MSTLTVRLPDDKHNRLKALAAHKKLSLNKLIEELTTQAIAEFDTEVRFKAIAATGDKKRGLELLDKLDSHFASLAPIISWFSTKYQAIKECLQTSKVAFRHSASAKPSVFFVQASFCAAALLFTSSGLLAFYFFMPSMLLNGVLA